MHGAIGSFGCESCHEPHGGASPKLLRSPATELCLGCHDARKLAPTGGNEGTKGEVTLLGRYRVSASQAAGIRSVVLSPDGRNHPVPGHRTLGKPTAAEIETVGENLTFTGELACVTCHNPHKGRSRYLFRGAALNPLDSCTSCHRK
jgi:predicted CXXCH cytochrome family protein